MRWSLIELEGDVVSGRYSNRYIKRYTSYTATKPLQVEGDVMSGIFPQHGRATIETKALRSRYTAVTPLSHRYTGTRRLHLSAVVARPRDDRG